MSLFAKKNRNAVAGNAAAIIGKASDHLSRQQLKFAAWLNSQTAGLSGKSKIIFLVIICMLFGGTSLYFLINAFH